MRGRLIRAGIAAAAGVLLALGVPAAAPAQTYRATAAPVMAWEGDSLTAGYYATTADRDFRSLAEAHYGASDYLAPDGGYGVTAAGFSAAFAHGATSVPGNSWAVVIELGTNDFGQNEALATFAAAIDNVVWWTRREAPTAKIVCMGAWYNGSTGPDGNGDAPGAFDGAIRAACVNEGGTMLYLYPYAYDIGPAGRSTFLGTSDAFHPNDVGHARAAAALICTIDGPVAAGCVG